MGALHPPHSRLSLDSRLSESLDIRDEICELLGDLYDAVKDVRTICSENDSNQAPFVDSTRDFILEAEDPEIEGEEGGITQDEKVMINLNMMNECMKALFRIGTLIRREVAHDRFQRALQQSKFSFPEQFDTDYVEHKHPKLKEGAGRRLAMRLGRANAKRRQFIKYGRDHSMKLETVFRQKIEPEPKTTPSIDLEALTEMLSSKATTFVKPKEQWNHGFLEPTAVEDDDNVSSLTASTTMNLKGSLKLPRLAEIGPEGRHFECPLCFTLQSFRAEKAWKSHAYNDLKAYICTCGGKECDSEMFADRATWFDHELRAHRSVFACRICREQVENQEHLRHHVLCDHTDFPMEQFPTLAEQGRLAPLALRAQDCPFCDDWARDLNSKRHPQGDQTESEPLDSDVLVVLSKFQKHVATHQEQLAIFTIPKSMDYDGPEGTGQNAGSDVAVNISEGSAVYSDISDVFVVESESMNEYLSAKHDTFEGIDSETGRPRVLLAEDNPINLAVLKRQLLHEGIQDIHTAEDGQEAYDTVKENFDRNEMFDLIFMDIQMPKLSGVASTQLIRKLGCDTPIIAMTPASSDTSRAHELIQMGVDEVILKPFRQPTVRKMLQKYGIASTGAGMSSFARELYMHDSYQTPTVDVESLISPLEEFLGNVALDDEDKGAGRDSNLRSVAALIAATLSGSGRVKTADLIDVLPHLHHNEIMNLRTEYKALVKVGPERKGVNVAKHIQARLKDNDTRLMTLTYATALGMWESEGYWIWMSLTSDDKTRIDQSLLIETLMGRSNTEARLVRDGFRMHSNKLEREHATSLEGFVDDYLQQSEPWFRDAVKAVLSGSKMEELDHFGQPRPIDMQLVEQDVDEMFEALNGQRGAATVVPQIVILRSASHLREVSTIYQRKYRSDFLTEALEKVAHSLLTYNVLFYVLYGVLNRPARDARLLHRALHDDIVYQDLLISRLVRAHWDSHYLSAVKQAYYEQYGRHMVDDISARTSGEWGAFCVKLAKSNLQWDERSREEHADM